MGRGSHRDLCIRDDSISMTSTLNDAKTLLFSRSKMTFPSGRFVVVVVFAVLTFNCLLNVASSLPSGQQVEGQSNCRCHKLSFNSILQS